MDDEASEGDEVKAGEDALEAFLAFGDGAETVWPGQTSLVLATTLSDRQYWLPFVSPSVPVT